MSCELASPTWRHEAFARYARNRRFDCCTYQRVRTPHASRYRADRDRAEHRFFDIRDVPTAVRSTRRDSVMIKVLLADDHTLVRDGLRHILRSASGFDIAGEAWDAVTTIALVRNNDANVLVLDLSMPGRNGIELIKQIKDEKASLRILVLTMHAEQQYAVRAFKAGASGYLTKESASTELVGAVTKVASGGVYISLSMAERFAQNLNEPVDALPHHKLSDREFDIFRRIVAGQRITEIANELCLSVKTVSTHKTRILEKMDMPNENALVRYAIRNKLIDDEDDL